MCFKKWQRSWRYRERICNIYIAHMWGRGLGRAWQGLRKFDWGRGWLFGEVKKLKVIKTSIIFIYIRDVKDDQKKSRKRAIKGDGEATPPSKRWCTENSIMMFNMCYVSEEQNRVLWCYLIFYQYLIKWDYEFRLMSLKWLNLMIKNGGLRID